jgi:hypothetical protein
MRQHRSNRLGRLQERRFAGHSAECGASVKSCPSALISIVRRVIAFPVCPIVLGASATQNRG